MIPEEHSDSQSQASLGLYGIYSSIPEARNRDNGSRLVVDSWVEERCSANWGSHCSALESSREYGPRIYFFNQEKPEIQILVWKSLIFKWTQTPVFF